MSVMWQATPQPYMYPVGPPVMVVPNVGGSRIPAPMAVYATPGGGTPQPQQQQQQPAQPPVLSESELKQVLHIIIDISSKRSKYFVTAM